MSREANLMDTVSYTVACFDRGPLLAGMLHDLIDRLRRPHDAAGQLRLHRALVALFQQLAVVDAIAFPSVECHTTVLSSDNAMVQVLTATAEADTARAEGRPRRHSAWAELEQAAGAILDAIAACSPSDGSGIADAYRLLCHQLQVADLVPTWPREILREVEHGHRATTCDDATAGARRTPSPGVSAAQSTSATTERTGATR